MKRLLFLIALGASGEALYPGIDYHHHTGVRGAEIHVVAIDLTQPGLRFRVTPPSGSRETVRQTTLDFLRSQRAQVAINAHFFEPFPTEDTDVFLIGAAASDGNAYSDYESPRQSYAILTDAPALNIDRENHAAIVAKGAPLFNAVAGSAQVITNGVKTIPAPPGDDAWYERIAARTLIGLSRDARRLVLMVIDHATVGEAADFLMQQYQVWDALNLDGGGSSSLAIEDPQSHEPRLLNKPPAGPRAVGSSLAVFAPAP